MFCYESFVHQSNSKETKDKEKAHYSEYLHYEEKITELS
jgi:hypothetical protein